MNFLPKATKGNGSLGTTASLLLAFAGMLVVVWFVAKELVGWFILVSVILLALYWKVASRSRRLGGIHIRY